MTTRLLYVWIGAFALAGTVAWAADTPAASGRKVQFHKVRLDDKFRSEGVAVADFNQDGKLDIAAGYVWYAAPDWQMHAIAAEPPEPPGALLGPLPSLIPRATPTRSAISPTISMATAGPIWL